jgi:hypothetical protein
LQSATASAKLRRHSSVRRRLALFDKRQPVGRNRPDTMHWRGGRRLEQPGQSVTERGSPREASGSGAKTGPCCVVRPEHALGYNPMEKGSPHPRRQS